MHLNLWSFIVFLLVGFLICGRDERGLMYALLEAARAVELAAPEVDVCAAIAPAIQSPHLAWRSMQLFLCNRRLEETWFYDEKFWDEYLERLARCRYNNLSLTFGHQIAYLSPPYPFLLEVPEFPEVRPIGFTAEQCARHLDMLIRIAEWTRQRGLHFTFGIWSQHAQDYGDSTVEGLTPEIRAQYNAAGLARLLAVCPGIDGVQFRMNYESGVAEDRQAEYYEPQFRAIAECGRPIRLDLRAKGLADDTIELAQEARSRHDDIHQALVRAFGHALSHAGHSAVRPEKLSSLRHLGSTAQAPLLCVDPPSVERGEPARAAVGRSRMGAAFC